MKILVLGGGIMGRLAKMLCPEAMVLEKKDKKDKIQAEIPGHFLYEPIEDITGKQVKIKTGYKAHNKNMGYLCERSMEKYVKKMDCEEWDKKGWYEDNNRWNRESKRYKIIVPDVAINYNIEIHKIDILYKCWEHNHHRQCYDIIINTLPLPILLKLIGINSFKFKYKPVLFRKSPPEYKIPEDEFWIEYDIRNNEWLRAFHSKEETIRETVQPCCGNFFHTTQFGKIFNHPHIKDILHFLEGNSIYCFGRYATWNRDTNINNEYDRLKSVVDKNFFK